MKKVLTSLIAAAIAAAALPAAAETVVIVSAKNPASRMFSEQAAQFFLGKSTMFTPIDQADEQIFRPANLAVDANSGLRLNGRGRLSLDLQRGARRPAPRHGWSRHPSGAVRDRPGRGAGPAGLLPRKGFTLAWQVEKIQGAVLSS